VTEWEKDFQSKYTQKQGGVDILALSLKIDFKLILEETKKVRLKKE
jgi:hypothetical protein